MKTLNKPKLQQTVLNHLSDIEFKDFMNIYENVQQNHIIF